MIKHLLDRLTVCQVRKLFSGITSFNPHTTSQVLAPHDLTMKTLRSRGRVTKQEFELRNISADCILRSDHLVLIGKYAYSFKNSTVIISN